MGAAAETIDRQKSYSFYVRGLILGALKNLGAGIGGQQIEVNIYELGTNRNNEPEQPFELDI